MNTYLFGSSTQVIVTVVGLIVLAGSIIWILSYPNPARKRGLLILTGVCALFVLDLLLKSFNFR